MTLPTLYVNRSKQLFVSITPQIIIGSRTKKLGQEQNDTVSQVLRVPQKHDTIVTWKLSATSVQVSHLRISLKANCKTAVHKTQTKTYEGMKLSVETVDATINNVLQSDYRAIVWVGDTQAVLEVQKACKLTFSEAWI